ncbi:MAG: hypothetical protein ABIO72_02490 [Patescibacteria group bacterium]
MSEFCGVESASASSIEPSGLACFPSPVAPFITKMPQSAEIAAPSLSAHSCGIPVELEETLPVELLLPPLPPVPLAPVQMAYSQTVAS